MCNLFHNSEREFRMKFGKRKCLIGDVSYDIRQHWRCKHVILQFFELMHAFKRAVFNHRDSVVTQVTTNIIHNILKNNNIKNIFVAPKTKTTCKNVELKVAFILTTKLKSKNSSNEPTPNKCGSWWQRWNLTHQ